MTDPDAPVYGVTPLQARLLLNADEEWRAPSALNDAITTAKVTHLIDALVHAGFLRQQRAGKRLQYRRTPAGAELAEYLQRLDDARAEVGRREATP